jgi:hypothetical protein
VEYLIRFVAVSFTKYIITGEINKVNTKKLNLNFDIVFKGWCWDAVRLFPIMSNCNNIPWYIKSFIPLQMNEEFLIQSYDISHDILPYFVSIYDEVLNITPIINYNRDNLINLIIEAIDNDRYILCGWDRYYVNGSTDFHLAHNNHGALIHGYNNKKNVLDVVDIGINGIVWATNPIDYNLFIEAFYNGKQMTQRENIPWNYLVNKPISSFNLKTAKAIVDPVRMWSDVVGQIEGYEYENKKRKEQGKDLFIARGGLKIYNGFQEAMEILINNSNYIKEDNRILLSIKYMHDNKLLYKIRLKYLFENRMISIDETLFDMLDTVNFKTDIIFGLIVKFMYKADFHYILRCKKEFSDLELIDTEFMTKFAELLEKGIKTYYRL